MIFVSYSHQDEAWKDRVVAHLGAVVRDREAVTVWDDRHIEAGQDWLGAIHAAIAKARIAVLLLSADYLSSVFIRNEELPSILVARRKQGVRLVPIVVRPCAWETIDWLSGMQLRPTGGSALSKHSDNVIEEELAAITVEVHDFLTGLAQPADQAAFLAGLPPPDKVLSATPTFDMPVLRGARINRQDILELDLIVHEGSAEQEQDALRGEVYKLARYFLTALTIPEEDLWVNLSPYEGDRIMPEALAMTDMGRELLGQDYHLKQFCASALFPERNPGRDFWAAVFHGTRESFGTANLPLNSFNKFWAVPDEAVVEQSGDMAWIVASSLRAMLDVDRTALSANLDNQDLGMKSLAEDSKDGIAKLMAEAAARLLLPTIERELNEGRSFAPLRQIYSALIIANWFKQTLCENQVTRQLADCFRVAGLRLGDDSAQARVYELYRDAAHRGVFSYIKSWVDPHSGESWVSKMHGGGFSARGVRALSAGRPGERPTFSRQEMAGGRFYLARTRLVGAAAEEFMHALRPLRTQSASDPGGIDLDLRKGRDVRTVRHGDEGHMEIAARDVQRASAEMKDGIVPVILSIEPVM